MNPAAVPAKNTVEEREEDPIRTMQKDIAMIQRGEYKPRQFYAPKVAPQEPANIWQREEGVSKPGERIESLEFNKPQTTKEEQGPGLEGEKAHSLADLSLSLGQTTEPRADLQGALAEKSKPQEEPAVPFKKETSPPISISELKNIPEFDVLGLESSGRMQTSICRSLVKLKRDWRN